MKTARIGAAVLALLAADVARGEAHPQTLSRPSAVGAVTFARDIAPIVFEHCASCHRPGGSAPFSLLTYPEVRGRARQIVTAIERRAMPPWQAEPGYGEFVGERRLTITEIAAFQAWIADGAPAGDLRQMPHAPSFDDEWQLGKPDIVLRLPPYRLAPTGEDQLRTFVIPIPTTIRQYVRGWEFRSSSPVVHHATLLLDSTRASRELDDRDPEPGYEGLIALSAKNPDGYFLGWTPGQRPYLAPERMAWPLEPRTDLVAMMHLRPNGQPETIDASVALYFSTRPATETPVLIRLNRQDIDIPPGTARYTATDDYILPVPVTVFGVQPHAHNLAREVRGFATLPDGTRKWLLYIRDWNFHWQDAYRFTTPMPLPAGTRLSMEFLYDNSEANPANPHHPPRRVVYGQRTSDEMGDFWIQVLPDRAVDSAALTSQLQRKLLPQNISGLLMMLTADPENASLHDDLALLFTRAGDFEHAAAQFGESARLQPTVPAAHYNLGNAFLNLRRWDEAADHFRRALALSPDYGLAHQGLGIALENEGHYDGALSSFERAVRLMPTSDVHYNLGVLLQARGDVDRAGEHYQEAVRLDPRSPEAHFALALLAVRRGDQRQAAAGFRRALDLGGNLPAAQLELAWICATSRDATLRDASEAIRLAERAVAALGTENAHALDVVGAAYAAAGDFRRAVTATRRALELLALTGDSDARGAVETRLALYERQTPYVDPGR